jgi:hypothetical protein
MILTKTTSEKSESPFLKKKSVPKKTGTGSKMKKQTSNLTRYKY